MKVIGIAGKARSGKTTAANYLVENHGYTIVSCAATLKKILMVALEENPPPWNLKSANEKEHYECIEDNRTPFTRWLLQFVGTDVCRALDETIWVNRMATVLSAYKANDMYCKIVIPDIRFANEVQVVRMFGGKVLKIIRGGFETIEHGKDHASEQTDELLCDCTIEPKEGVIHVRSSVTTVLGYLES